MRATLAQASSLYVILPLLALLFAAAMVLHAMRGADGRLPTGWKLALNALIIVYLGVYAYLTIFYRSASQEPQLQLGLFWSYRKAFAGGRIKRLGLARQILLNILVYVPVGMLMPVAYGGRKHPLLLSAATGFGLSVLTEAAQYVSRRGLCEVDDVLNNTLGCLLGIGLFAAGAAVLRAVSGRRGKP